MGLPAKLKNFILFVDGGSYAGEVPELSLPKLSRMMEDYRAGGMGGAVKYDMGQEPIEFDWTAGGMVRSIIGQYGARRHDAIQLRFAGAYQADDSGEVIAAEVVVRGRHQELDFGNQQAGKDTDLKVKTVCSYYKLSMNGATVIEIDQVNNVLVVNGNDLMADIREALGLSGGLSVSAGGLTINIGV